MFKGVKRGTLQPTNMELAEQCDSHETTSLVIVRSWHPVWYLLPEPSPNRKKENKSDSLEG